MTVLLLNGEVDDLSCDVRIEKASILVGYRDGSETAFYRGPMKGPGHWLLKKDGGGGQATLHQLPGDYALEGWWVEDGERGAWRIELKGK